MSTRHLLLPALLLAANVCAFAQPREPDVQRKTINQWHTYEEFGYGEAQ